ncbi:calcium release-activated calcium channel protein 1 isoform X1 [Drosophila navojoa]|uniref:calcium release-activated calcium channel protein 1 isoform X1 n=1 Tax=Drosophila navojoa TaxID=7232 RepID=UPI000846C389|nr:calcium release-activated calcium channel protein 1 isoform X1 [Drosophila navojoa]XP_017960767.1 calcium release-activated calcium channel protein 1 isoform X1 [Drosophila navojoa]XP_030240606.1 calcium release-activated calcium channel protein 1 isoform X1 [Drosophila navojoa]XP_030240607.1 calcium release-activated calcium channel protein 1 isoform X1 [Drosophila navojoa]
MRSTCDEVPLKPPRRQKLQLELPLLEQNDQQQQQQQQQQDKESECKKRTRDPVQRAESENLLPLNPKSMYSNLRYARTNLSHSSLLLNHQQSSFDGSAPTSTERTESSETLDTPLTRDSDREDGRQPLHSARLLPCAANRIETKRFALASALHATARLAASVDAYTAAATASATHCTGSHCHGSDYSSMCDSCRPQRQAQQQQQQQTQNSNNFSRTGHSGPSSYTGSARFFNLSNLHSANSPHASSRRFNAHLTSQPPPPPPPPFPLPLAGAGPAASIPRRITRSSMSQSGEDLHSPTYLSWRKLQLSRAKLKASSKTSALLSGFAMVAMVEVQLDKDTGVPPGMLVAFAICTTLLVAVHMLALMISTCILPNIETVCNLHSITLVHESPHERLHWYIETAWAFSTLLGLILFLVEIAILCWVKFYDLSTTAAWSAVVVLIPVMIVFLAFAVHFYRSLVTHKYEVTVSGIRELELLKEQMEQEHLEVHNNARNNGFNYGASGDIV